MRPEHVDPSCQPDPRTARRLARLERYENRTAWFMVGLAVLYLGIYAAQVLLAPVTEPWRSVLSVVGWTIWVLIGLRPSARRAG